MRESIPRFLNGVYSFVGAGYEKPSLLSGKLTSTRQKNSVNILSRRELL
jgi:hypothetical protein